MLLRPTGSITLKVTAEGAFLARCAGCGASHPMARRPPIDCDRCPDCGAPAASPRRAFGKPMVTDLFIRTGDALLKIGAALFNLAKDL